MFTLAFLLLCVSLVSGVVAAENATSPVIYFGNATATRRVVVACQACPALTVIALARSVIGFESHPGTLWVTAMALPGDGFCAALSALLQDPRVVGVLLPMRDQCGFPTLFPHVHFVLLHAGELNNDMLGSGGATASLVGPRGWESMEGCVAGSQAREGTVIATMPNVHVDMASHLVVLYLVGAALAAQSNTSVVAYVAAPHEVGMRERFSAFAAGVAAVCPQCKPLIEPLFNDTSGALGCEERYQSLRARLTAAGSDAVTGTGNALDYMWRLALEGIKVVGFEEGRLDRAADTCLNTSLPLQLWNTSSESDSFFSELVPVAAGVNASVVAVFRLYTKRWLKHVTEVLADPAAFHSGVAAFDPWLPGEIYYAHPHPSVATLRPGTAEALAQLADRVRYSPKVSRPACQVIDPGWDLTLRRVGVYRDLKTTPRHPLLDGLATAAAGTLLLTSVVTGDGWIVDPTSGMDVVGLTIEPVCSVLPRMVTGAVPPPRTDASFVGGSSCTGSAAVLGFGRDLTTRHALGDVWVLSEDPQQQYLLAWRKVWPGSATAPTSPGLRYGQAMVAVETDAVDGRSPCLASGLFRRRYEYLLFGGAINSHASFGDAWRLTVACDSTASWTYIGGAALGLVPRVGHYAATIRLPGSPAVTHQDTTSRSWVLLLYGDPDLRGTAAVGQLYAVDARRAVSIGFPSSVVWDDVDDLCVTGSGAGVAHVLGSGNATQADGSVEGGIVLCKLHLSTTAWFCRVLDTASFPPKSFRNCLHENMPQDDDKDRSVVFLANMTKTTVFALGTVACELPFVPDTAGWACARCPDDTIAVGTRCVPCGSAEAAAATIVSQLAASCGSSNPFDTTALAILVTFSTAAVVAGAVLFLAFKTRRSVAEATVAEEAVERTVAAVAGGTFADAKADLGLRSTGVGSADLRLRLWHLLRAMQAFESFLPDWLFSAHPTRPDLAPRTLDTDPRGRAKSLCAVSSRAGAHHGKRAPEEDGWLRQCLRRVFTTEDEEVISGAPQAVLLYRQRVKPGLLVGSDDVAVVMAELSMSDVTAELNSGAVMRLASRFIAAAHAIADHYEGHVSGVAGDHVLLCFNAVRHCFTPRRSAALAAAGFSAFEPPKRQRRTRRGPGASSGMAMSATHGSFGVSYADASLEAEQRTHGGATHTVDPDYTTAPGVSWRVHCAATYGECRSGVIASGYGSRDVVLGEPVRLAQRLLALARSFDEPEPGCVGTALCDFTAMQEEAAEVVVLKALGVLSDAAVPGRDEERSPQPAQLSTKPGSAIFSAPASPAAQSRTVLQMPDFAAQQTPPHPSLGTPGAALPIAGCPIIAAIVGLRPRYARMASPPPEDDAAPPDLAARRRERLLPKAAAYAGPDLTLNNDLIIARVEGDDARIAVLRKHEQWRRGGDGSLPALVVFGPRGPSRPSLSLSATAATPPATLPLPVLPESPRSPRRHNASHGGDGPVPLFALPPVM